MLDSCLVVGPSEKTHVSDEVLYEYSDISESECSSDSEIDVKISSCGEQSVGSDEEENVSDG